MASEGPLLPRPQSGHSASPAPAGEADTRSVAGEGPSHPFLLSSTKRSKSETNSASCRLRKTSYSPSAFSFASSALTLPSGTVDISERAPLGSPERRPLTRTMCPKDARHRNLGADEDRRGTAGCLHGAANRLDALALGLRELQARQEPRQGLVSPARSQLVVAVGQHVHHRLLRGTPRVLLGVRSLAIGFWAAARRKAARPGTTMGRTGTAQHRCTALRSQGAMPSTSFKRTAVNRYGPPLEIRAGPCPRCPPWLRLPDGRRHHLI